MDRDKAIALTEKGKDINYTLIMLGVERLIELTAAEGLYSCVFSMRGHPLDVQVRVYQELSRRKLKVYELQDQLHCYSVDWTPKKPSFWRTLFGCG